MHVPCESYAWGRAFPLALYWRGSSAILGVAGARSNFKHHHIDPNSAFKRTRQKLSVAYSGLRPCCVYPSPFPTPSHAAGVVCRGGGGLLPPAGLILPLDLWCAVLYWCTLRQGWTDIYICHIDDRYQDLKILFWSAVARNMLHCKSYLKVSHVNKDCLQEESHA